MSHRIQLAGVPGTGRLQDTQLPTDRGQSAFWRQGVLGRYDAFLVFQPSKAALSGLGLDRGLPDRVIDAGELFTDAVELGLEVLASLRRRLHPTRGGATALVSNRAQSAQALDGSLEEGSGAGVTFQVRAQDRSPGREVGHRCRHLRDHGLVFLQASGERSELFIPRAATGIHFGKLDAGEKEAKGADLVLQAVIALGGLGLAAQRAQLALDLTEQVLEAEHVLIGALQASLGLLLAPPVFEDPGGFLDDRSVLFRRCIENGVDLALADDHVLMSPDPGIAEQLLDIQQAGKRLR